MKEMMKKFHLEFSRVEVCEYEPLWKQILWVSVYEWDSHPYGLTIRVLGFDFQFYVGKWDDEDDL